MVADVVLLRRIDGVYPAVLSTTGSTSADTSF